MAYYDVVVIPVPADRKAEYEEMVRVMADVFLSHGATEVVDLWGDDVPVGEVTSLPRAVKAEANEAVVSGWVAWPSKEVRDAGWDSAMADPRMPGPGTMPFDGKRMIFGGFTVMNHARKDG